MKEQRIILILTFIFALFIILPAFTSNTVSATNTTLITNGSSGTGGNSNSGYPSISADGKYITYDSSATDLIPGTTTNSYSNIFLYNTSAGTTTLITKGSSGTGGNRDSYLPSISADGKYITYHSYATDLISGTTTNSYTNIFLYNTETGTTTLITKGSSGTGGNGWSYSPRISADGQYITYHSSATDLIPGTTTNSNANIFLYNTGTGTTTLITQGTSGKGGNRYSYLPSISADGKYITYQSTATDLIPGTTTNSYTNIFLYNTGTGTTTLITKGSSGTGGNIGSYCPSISVDGKYITYQSSATDLISGTTTNSNYNIFLYNTETGTTTLITKGSSGTGGNMDSYYTSISADGKYITYQSSATDLISGTTTNSNSNIFLYNIGTGITTLITKGSSGTGGNSGSYYTSVSADGNYITYMSYATDLISGTTTNSNSNIFLFSNVITTITTVSNVQGYAGQQVTLTAYVTAANSNIISNGTVTFTVNGTKIGTVNVNNGQATTTWTIPTTWKSGAYIITANYDGTNTNYANSQGTATLTVKPSAYLSFTNSVTSGTHYYGDAIKYYLTVKNTGPDNANGVMVYDKLPTGLIYKSATATSGSYKNSTSTWTIGILKAGQTAKLTITAMINQVKTITNTATLKQTTYPTTPIKKSNSFTVPAVITIPQLIVASSTIKNYYESHHKLPVSLKIAGQNLTMPQMLKLLCTATLNINNHNYNPLKVTTVTNPNYTRGSYTTGNLYTQQYLQTANNIKNFINKTGRAPNYAQTKLGNIPYTKLIYMYSKIINFYGTKKRLPHYVYTEKLN